MRKWRLKIEVQKNIQILRVEETFRYMKKLLLWPVTNLSISEKRD